MSEQDSGPNDGMTVAELKQYAADNDIDLGDASRKADILDVLNGTLSTDPATGSAPEGTQAASPAVTRLDDDVTKPSTVAPGDAPYDTTDPSEEASTVGGDKAAAAREGHGTVNAVLPVKRTRPKAARSESRIETYDATRPNGDVVTIERNIDTGESRIVNTVKAS